MRAQDSAKAFQSIGKQHPFETPALPACFPACQRITSPQITGLFSLATKHQSGFPTTRVPVLAKSQFKETYSHRTFGLLAFKPSIDPGCWETQPSNLTKCLAYKLRWAFLVGQCWPFGQLHDACKWLHLNSHVQCFAAFHPTSFAQAGRTAQEKHV